MSWRGFVIATAGFLGFVVGCSEDPGRGGKPQAATQGDQGQHESADVVVQHYFDAFQACDWNALAGLMHPQALLEIAHAVRPAIHKSKAKNLLSELGIQSIDEVDVMSPTVLFEKLLAIKMKLRPTLLEVYRSSACTILGDVTEGELVHVVIRGKTTSSKGVEGTWIETVSLKPSGGEWRMLLTRDFETEMKSTVPDAERGR